MQNKEGPSCDLGENALHCQFRVLGQGLLIDNLLGYIGEILKIEIGR